MELPDHIFRHEALDTITLDYLVDKKNSISTNETFTYGVHASDSLPDEFFAIDDCEFNWISNTDRSSEPGKHWVCVCVKKEMIYRKENHLECVKNKIIIMDSWDVTSAKTCEKITDNIIDAYHANLYNHMEKFDSTQIKCRCSMTIEFPVKYRIQYSSYENCGWFALYFASMNFEEINYWLNSHLNTYGKITNNYENIVNYFKIIFFPKIKDNPCPDFMSYRFHICKLQEKKGILCNQCCCSYNKGMCSR